MLLLPVLYCLAVVNAQCATQASTINSFSSCLADAVATMRAPSFAEASTDTAFVVGTCNACVGALRNQYLSCA